MEQKTDLMIRAFGRPRTRRRARAVQVGLVLLFACAIGFAIFFPVQGGRLSTSTMCMATEKNIVLSAIMYSNDYDERYPLSNWIDSLTKYVTASWHSMNPAELFKRPRRAG